MKQIISIVIILNLMANSCGQSIKKQSQISEIADTSFVEDFIDSTNLKQDDNNYIFDIRKIDSAKFFSLKKSVNAETIKLERIEDLEQAKKILKGRVLWGTADEETNKLIKDEQGDMVYEILFRNGKTILYDYPELNFVAYFPQEDILILEGESPSMIFNLTTGEETEDVVHPEYRRDSPSKEYRFNGYSNSEASIYFIQKKSGTHYKTIIELDLSIESELARLIGFSPEYLPDMFWQNDTILNFIAPRYFYPENKTEFFYYQLILKKI